MGKTTIEWCTHTWNPIRGCSRVSEGCRNCYAEKVAARFSGKGLPYEGLTTPDGRWNGKVAVVEEHLADPLRWKTPRRIFVNSMSDLFHENVSDRTIDRIFAVMALCPQHTFQVLTKRAERLAAYMTADRDAWTSRIGAIQHHCDVHYARTSKHFGMDHRTVVAHCWPLPNVWLGVSVEDQAAADARIPHLLRTPAAVRFLSVEPMLGAVDLEKVQGRRIGCLHMWFQDCAEMKTQDSINWVICGGESGPKARPMHPDWARSLRDQCLRAGVPYFFKQWGEWMPTDDRGHVAPDPRVGPNTVHCWVWPSRPMEGGGQRMARVGKKAAGRQLDGREWNEFPKETARV